MKDPWNCFVDYSFKVDLRLVAQYHDGLVRKFWTLLHQARYSVDISPQDRLHKLIFLVALPTGIRVSVLARSHAPLSGTVWNS